MTAKSKQNLTANTSSNAFGASFQPEYNIFEARNGLLPGESKQKQYEQVLAELRGYIGNKDTSKVLDFRGGQGEILEKVLRALEENPGDSGIYIAVTKFFSERDLQLTDQLSKIGLRLIRLYELQRQGTTDVMDFSTSKDVLKDHTFDLLQYYKGDNRQRAIFILKNVENSQAGTAEIGLAELQQTRDMVQTALRAELQNTSQAVLPPHRIESVQGDMKVAEADINPKVMLYLRLFESLTIAIMKQQTITKEKETFLELKREEVLNSLDRLAGMPGIVITKETRGKFEDKISVMSMDELKFFDFKITDLARRYNHKEIDFGGANGEIAGWLHQNFDKKEFDRDLAERTERNRKADEQKKVKIRAILSDEKAA